MIGIIPITRILTLAIYSAAVNSQNNPVSILLVGRPESGKSAAINEFAGNRYTVIRTDMTAYGFATDVLMEIYKTKMTYEVLLPDLINPLSRSHDAAASFIAMISAFMEEGVRQISTKFIQVPFKEPVKGGIITSITPEELKWRRKHWTATGFLSRFLVISFDHDIETQQRVMAHIRESAVVEDKDVSRVALNLPLTRQSIYAEPELLLPITRYVPEYLKNLGLTDSAYGYRAHWNLERLALAAALERGDRELKKEDVDLVLNIVTPWANLDCNPMF